MMHLYCALCIAVHLYSLQSCGGGGVSSLFLTIPLRVYYNLFIFRIIFVLFLLRKISEPLTEYFNNILTTFLGLKNVSCVAI